MGHTRGKLTPVGRLLLIQRITELGWPVSQAAASLGISRETAHRWLRRWHQEGHRGLDNRSSRPHRSPRRLAASVERRILRLRRRLKWGPHRLAPLVGSPRSTIYAVLRRHGLSRLRDLDRSTGVPIRYVRDHPGELLHLDMKPLARVPQGGGHRILGRSPATKHRGAGYEVVHVAIDDASRLAFAQILPDGRGPTAARFLLEAVAFFAEQGIRIERVMTDRGYSYTISRTFQQVVRHLRIRHKITRPYRPQTNGKAERFVQTLLREWAYARLYLSNQDRRRTFPKWLHYYNHHRPHTALGGHVPASASVNNVCGNH
ncbi:MAG TPA: IS481 family transposase, partial [bacterium]|nr:IS481 family transposase [bacterium]